MIIKFQKLLTGIEISASEVKIVQIRRLKKGWRLVKYKSFPLPPQTLRLSYKTKNINNSNKFINTINDALKFVNVKRGRIGLSLPNEIIKIFIQKYKELPKSKKEIEKMIAWGVKKSFNFSSGNIKLSYYILRKSKDDDQNLLVAIGVDDVIREYELNLNKLKINVGSISPAGINLLNFYSPRLPLRGIIAFLAIFTNYVTFMVFDNAIPIFYHGIRKFFPDRHFFRDLDMIFQIYMDNNRNKKIEKLYFTSQIGCHRQLRKGLMTIVDVDIFMMDEDLLISLGPNLANQVEMEQISPFASAIGAGQSLLI
ncbi:Pilus assembly protein PilM [Candidatus Magnetomoraceae bacterium gMMP-15]